MTDFTLVFQIIMGLISAFVTAVIVPYIKNKTDAQQLESMLRWTQVAVNAAEQIYSESGRGKEKSAYVCKFLSDHGLELNDAILAALIESSVNAMNIEQRTTQTRNSKGGF